MFEKSNSQIVAKQEDEGEGSAVQKYCAGAFFTLFS